MKTFNQSPLPFQGQKRRFVQHFKQALKGFPSNAVYIDLFGGSGLLAHNVKQVYPTARVIYNDYDNFSARIAAIPHTNIILQELRSMLANYPRSKRITEPLRSQIIKYIQQQDKAHKIDYITLSASLLFSAEYATNFAELVTEIFYNKIRRTNYNADGYLQDVEVVRKDYKQLFAEYKNAKNVVFLADPPYLSTDSSSYTSKKYWKLRDYLDVLQVLNNQNYFYFTSNKSHIVELCEWISSVSTTANPFQTATCTMVNAIVNHNAKYTDIMYHLKK